MARAHLWLVSAATAAALGASSPAGAECLGDLQERATELTFDLELELERQHTLSKDEFGSIRRAVRRLERFLDGALGSRCLQRAPVQRRRFVRWTRRGIRPLIAATQKRLDYICTRRTRFLIEQETHRIERALAGERLAYARRRADALARALESDPVIRACEPARDEVQAALTGLVAETRNRAALPRVTEEAAAAFFEASRRWSEAKEALATAGERSRPAPEIFETDEGLARFRDLAERCMSRAAALRRMGAPDDHQLQAPDGERTPLTAAEAATRCREMRDGAPAMAGVVRSHNAAHKKRLLERWVYLHVKGWDMQKVFDRLGKPEAVKRRGAAIVWSYRAPCRRLRFSARGKKLGEQRCD